MRIAILSLALVACGGGDDDGGGGTDPTVVLMESVGAGGGSFDGDGVRVSVPADAVTGTIELTVTSQDQAVAGYTRYSPVFTFEPRDQVVEGSILVEIEASEADGIFYWTDLGSETFGVVGGAYDGDWVAATVDHLGRGFVGRPGETGGMCGDGPACTPPDVCLDGVCMPYQTP